MASALLDAPQRRDAPHHDRVARRGDQEVQCAPVGCPRGRTASGSAAARASSASSSARAESVLRTIAAFPRYFGHGLGSHGPTADVGSERARGGASLSTIVFRSATGWRALSSPPQDREWRFCRVLPCQPSQRRLRGRAECLAPCAPRRDLCALRGRCCLRSAPLCVRHPDSKPRPLLCGRLCRGGGGVG